MADFWKQLISFGAAGRIERATAGRDEMVAQVVAAGQQVAAKRAHAQVQLERLLSAKISGLAALKKIETISKNLGVRDRQLAEASVGEDLPQVALTRVRHTLETGDVAMSVARGSAAGISTALGAWGLVSTMGTASTGTAIASLSGAAATNATLAWFGGGAIAAGGSGMAAGAAVIGGVVAVPALLATAAFVHVRASKKIEWIERESLDLVVTLDHMKTLDLVADLAARRASELTLVVAQGQKAFEHELRRVYRTLYPFGWLSRAWRRIRAMVTGHMFNAQDMGKIQVLLRAAGEFAGILDQKVMDETGTVRR